MVGDTCAVCASQAMPCLLLLVATWLYASNTGISRMKNLGVPEGFTQFSYVTGHQGWTLSFANLCDVDSSERRRILVQKEEVTRLRWLRKEMALRTWGLQKQKKGAKKVMGGKKDADTTSVSPNF